MIFEFIRDGVVDLIALSIARVAVLMFTFGRTLGVRRVEPQSGRGRCRGDQDDTGGVGQAAGRAGVRHRCTLEEETPEEFQAAIPKRRALHLSDPLAGATLVT